MNRMDCYYRIGKLSAARESLATDLNMQPEYIRNEKLFAAYSALDNAFREVLHAEAEHSIKLKGDEPHVH